MKCPMADYLFQLIGDYYMYTYMNDSEKYLYNKQKLFMKFDIHSLIGEATAYDKKQQIEAKRPKSWLKKCICLC